MKNSKIEDIVQKIVKESLKSKEDKLTRQINSEMKEWDQQVTISAQPTDISEDDEIEMRRCDENSPEYDKELCKYNKKAKKMGKMDQELDEVDIKNLTKGKKYKFQSPSFEDEIEFEDEYTYPESKPLYNFKGKKSHHMMGDKHVEDFVTDIDEELIGGQKKLDVAKPKGKLTADDFKKLRGMKKTGKVREQWDDQETDDVPEIETSEPDERTSLRYKFMRKKHEPTDIEFEEIPSEEKSSYWKKIKKKFGLDEVDVEEGNAFTGALAKAKEEGKKEFEVDGETFQVRESDDKKFIQKAMKKMEKKGTEGSFKEYCGGEVTKSCIEKAMKSDDPKIVKKANFAKNIKAYKGAEHKKKVKESFQLTENELIDLIEKIVKEEKKLDGTKPKGLSQTEKVLKASEKENKSYLKSVEAKMKDYLKTGSKGSYNMNPENFPKGNGELAKMAKKAYIPDQPTQEYIDNFTAAGLENLVYDEIHPDQKWDDDNIEGSSRTGNNPKWANAVDTGVNKKRNQVRKDNLLGAVKTMAANKAPQPVVDDSKSGPTGKFQKNFGSNAAKKASKILNQLESTENENNFLLSEEFSKMKELIDYNKKTQ